MGAEEQPEASPWQLFLQRTIYSASLAASQGAREVAEKAEHFRRPAAAFAAASTTSEAPKKKRRPQAKENEAKDADVSADFREKAVQILANMTPEEQRKLKAAFLLDKMKKKKIRVDGKRTNLYKLGKDIVREQQMEEVGGYEPQLRDRPRWEVQESIPGEKLRPGAYKMQLRPEEEEELPLDLLARGHRFSPHPFIGYALGGRRDFTFGIYARADEARELLKDKWAGLPRDEVIFNQEFYEDILDNVARLELTVMVMPVRPLPLQAVRDSFLKRVALGLRQVPGKPQLISEEPLPEEDAVQLQRLRDCFKEEEMTDTGLLDDTGNLLPESHFIFTTLPDSSFMAEMITPGMLKDRRGFMAGPFKSPRLTRAAFSTVLGTYCIDPQAKAQAGQAAVYVINGFKLGLDLDNPNQYFSDKNNKPIFPKMEKEVVAPVPQSFACEQGSGNLLLLHNIERRLQGLPSLS